MWLTLLTVFVYNRTFFTVEFAEYPERLKVSKFKRIGAENIATNPQPGQIIPVNSSDEKPEREQNSIKRLANFDLNYPENTSVELLKPVTKDRQKPRSEMRAPQVGDVSQVLTRTPVGPVLSTIRVEFSLLTKGDQQFVAFYSPTRAMTVAQRTLGNSTWRFKELPSKIGWDNHNWVILGLDETGCLHVSGNMHASPLVYFKASKPLDIDSLVQERIMVGDGTWKFMEYQTTYPLFLNTPDGELVYHYRHGMSMSGGTLINIYNATARAWRRLHGGNGLLVTGMAVPLAMNPRDMNPYTSLRRGPDGHYHLIWLWRDNADASSCHHLCYARSPDLRSWETADGRPLATPITFNDTEQVCCIANMRLRARLGADRTGASTGNGACLCRTDRTSAGPREGA